MNGTGVPLFENWSSVIRQLKFRYHSIAVRRGTFFGDIEATVFISLVQRACHVHYVPVAASARVEHKEIAKILEQLDSVAHPFL